MESLIHLIKPKESNAFQVLSFFIPIMIFILLIIVILSKTKSNNQQAAVTQTNQAVLGNETKNTK